MPLLVASMVVLLLQGLAWPISALVRRYYGTPYRLAGMDARAHRLVRIAALLVLVAMGAMLALVVSMLSDLALTSPATDGLIIALRLFATVVLPLGAAAAVWNAWHVLRGRRRILAKLWALLLALACLRSEEHTSELQSLMRISYAVFCLKKKKSYQDGCTILCKFCTRY